MECKNCKSEMESVDQFAVWCPQCGTITNGETDSSEWWQHPKNLGEGEAGTGYALLSDVLAEDLKCCGNCKCYDVIDDKGSVCMQDTENGWTEMPVEHTAICDDWIYDDLIKKSRVK